MLPKKILDRIDEQRAQLTRLQMHDADEIAATRRRIVRLEGSLRGAKLQQALIASHDAALSRFDAELARLAALRKRLCHLLAHACANGNSCRRYIAALSACEFSEATVSLCRAEIQNICIDSPTKQLTEIEKSIADQPATVETVQPTH